ncbi:hypothetical protein EHS25_004051 [Saitozyma podzolica]|uniref:Uncharacterized protein n=1 Tax=Saitozyma podzolica TaxID=1890683 RepID=A0A427YSX1_9TREE|nr:hypothetical protein EHS25_004051 [Saitozyma podzolica]
MMLRQSSLKTFGLGVIALAISHASAYRVPIADTDDLREVCSGMWGGKEAYIEVSFNPESSGQVALVLYEWSDVPYLGVDTPDNSKTYICTTSAVRSGLCTSSQLGSFITSLPADKANSSSIFTTALKFSSSSFPTSTTSGDTYDPAPIDDEDEDGFGTSVGGAATGSGSANSAASTSSTSDDFEDGAYGGYSDADDLAEVEGDEYGDDAGYAGISGSLSDAFAKIPPKGPERRQGSSSGSGDVPTYSTPITYAVKKTGYYCVGIVPVTLVNSRSDIAERQATHAEYSGVVLFRNVFDGELPAVEYPKINFYMALSITYFLIGCLWAFLCVRHFRELLPMQYYISGTIVFLVIEMLANFAYYRYINKHGGGAGSLAFLFVVAILNAARNSLSFFLLLIVSMGLSVVTQSLGSVMLKIRALTAFHFIFGVLYSVGTVEVELDSASLFIVMILIFPLSLTLTAFLMWIIVSLNGTILHLQQRKQRYKLQMFQRLWRVLILAVIAVAAFFVVSSMSLSNRLDEDYAPRNWRFRWILLDGSLSTIYLVVFASIAWLWRPTRDNVRFSMSQELAQDEADADAEDYEIDALESGRLHQRLPTGEEDGDDRDGDEEESKGLVNGRHKVGEENVVFAMGEDSDEEDERPGPGGSTRDRPPEYRDVHDDEEEEEEEAEADAKTSRRKAEGKDD